MVYDCVIVGGGAAGLTAAIVLGRQKKKVLLIEQCKELGKKLYATGNGRCNFTNSYYDKEVYRGEDAEFANIVTKQFTYQDTIRFMHSIGVMHQVKDGYYYPYTNQAKTVVNAMITAIDPNFVTFCIDRIVKSVTKMEKGFHIVTSYGEFDATTVLFATGGKAALSLRKEPFHGYDMAKQLGHSITAVVPALCPLYSSDSNLKDWKGIRLNGSVQIFSDKALKEPISPAAAGELQLTDYGISGVPVFKISRYASMYLHQNECVYAKIDMLPEFAIEDLASLKKEYISNPENTVMDYLNTYFLETISKMILNRANLTSTIRFLDLTQKQWMTLIHTAKNWRMRITGTADFERAQVAAGGVSTQEIDPDTMESKIVKGLYFAGELLDIDGTCGGYNIQFAISSAQIAANAIADVL